jgi:predicted pyridoxine 5'-phosphate oxidase superfamily flavin-nucleotide-binding protein
MNLLPDEVLAAWNDRERTVVLTTVDAGGRPNSIYASIAHLTNDGRLAVCDNYFDKTKANIDARTGACLLFITKSRKSYQVKGTIDYHSGGPLYEEMLSWSDPKHPRKGVAVLNPESIYRGKDRIA